MLPTFRIKAKALLSLIYSLLLAVHMYLTVCAKLTHILKRPSFRLEVLCKQCEHAGDHVILW